MNTTQRVACGASTEFWSTLQTAGYTDRLLYLDPLARDGSGLFAKACELDLEGIVAKWAPGQYITDNRIKNPAHSQLEGRHELFERP